MKFILWVFTITTLFSCKRDKQLLSLLNSNDTGISFNNRLTPNAHLNILNYLYYYNGSGVSAGDFNNDGLTDLYFTANQTEDKLYLNLGELKFKDITDESGINNASNWTTGSTTVDINNDGLLDIYICKIGEYNKIKGQNLLFVNQGIKDGIPTFKEEAAKYGLAIKSFSTQSVFFDYDQDEDLDMFLLNHSVHPNRNYGLGEQRDKPDSLSGDRLYRNDSGIFKEVSKEAGIFQGKIGYGLGVSVGDLNNDGFPDLYIGNDFFENDYLYMNQTDGTFKEIISSEKTKLGHTSHFSMGNVINDINNDGLQDIISLDMLPEDIVTYKSSGLEYAYSTYERYLKNGYSPQFMQNTLHLNNGNGTFKETAHLSGIAATEWSWSPIVADLDNDGFKDIYVTNGILGATNDMDFINFISNDAIQKRLGSGMDKKDILFAEKMPTKKVNNYIFKNNGNNTFTDFSDKWSTSKESYSNGGIEVDLDNDGDLDIVVNNVNENAFILKNNARELQPTNNYLSIGFKGPENNHFGIGAKVIAYTNSKTLIEENYTTKGYLSSTAPKIHLGLGQIAQIDSLEIIWPGGKYQTLRDLNTNQEVIVDYKKASGNYFSSQPLYSKGLMTNGSALFNYKHSEYSSIEYDREPLIPFASTNTGSSTTLADINNDSLTDVFIGGGKMQAGHLYIQQIDGTFIKTNEAVFETDAINEDTDNTFFDANGDGYKDLLVVSGGNEFKQGKALQPRLYINKNGNFIKDSLQFKDIELNASKVSAVDIDNDGDLDISIASDIVPWEFGNTSQQYLFLNDGKGYFNDVTAKFGNDFRNIGNVSDITWVDINSDGYNDAIVAGHWMPISILINDGKQLRLQENNNLNNTNGWWNTIKAEDFDKDGDIDIIAGNWGLNTRLKASEEMPITLYNSDFDDNGKVDPVVTYFHQGKETPFASKDELVKQLPFLNKKFLSYQDFAKASLTDLFTKEKLANANKKSVHELASCYFENKGDNTFVKHFLPFSSQISSVNDIAIDDFNADGFLDVLLVGNNYEISTQLGKLDASHGTILLNDQQGFFNEHKNQGFDVSGPARSIKKIKVGDDVYYIITMNNDVPVFLKKAKTNAATNL